MASGPEFKKLTPVLIAEEIEPSVDFWVRRLGFEKTVEVPEGNKLGFAALCKGAVEVMCQSRQSVQKDIPTLVGSQSAACIYIEVDSLESVISRLEGVPVVVARRTTAYGADEIFVREPSGAVVGFAAQR